MVYYINLFHVKTVLVLLFLSAMSFYSQNAYATEDIDVYAQLPRTSGVSVSPDGQRVAILRPHKGSKAIFIYNLEKPQAKVKVIPTPQDSIVKTVFWGGNKNIVLRAQFPRKASWARTHTKQALFSRYVSYNIDTNAPAILMKKLLQKEADTRGGATRQITYAGSVIHSLPNDAKHILISRSKYIAPNAFTIHYKVNLDTGKATTVRRLDINTQNVIFDVTGEEMLARSTYDSNTETYNVYFVENGKERQVFSKKYAKGELPNYQVVGIEPDKTKLLFLDSTSSGNPFFTIDTKTGARGAFEIPAQRPRNLNFQPLTDRFTGKIIGIGYVDDHYRQKYLAEPYKGWHRKISKALPGKNIRISSWTKDHQKITVYAEGPTDSGEYYLFEPERKSLSSLGKRYPELDENEVGRTFKADFTARDGLKIPAYITLPPGKTLKDGPFSLVAMPHGGPQARDNASFDFWAQYIAAHNVAVFKPNFRGSDGYGYDFVKKGHGEFGGKMLDDTIDGILALDARGIIDKNKVCVTGASYGGYQAFALPVRDKDLFKCSISVNGVSDLTKMLKWVAGGRGSGRNNFGSRYWYKWMGHYAKEPEKVKQFSPAKNLDGVKTEFVILHGELDPVVPYEQSEYMAKALKKIGQTGEIIAFPGDDHNLSLPQSRKVLLEESAKLFSKHLDWKD